MNNSKKAWEWPKVYVGTIPDNQVDNFNYDELTSYLDILYTEKFNEVEKLKTYRDWFIEKAVKKPKRKCNKPEWF